MAEPADADARDDELGVDERQEENLDGQVAESIGGRRGPYVVERRSWISDWQRGARGELPVLTRCVEVQSAKVAVSRVV